MESLIPAGGKGSMRGRKSHPHVFQDYAIFAGECFTGWMSVSSALDTCCRCSVAQVENLRLELAAARAEAATLRESAESASNLTASEVPRWEL